MAFHFPQRRSASAQRGGTIASVLSHAVLIAAALHSTAVSASRIGEAISERLAYMPPPNRVPRMEAAVEHLTYLDIGGGGQIVPVASTGQTRPSGPLPIPSPGGERGTDAAPEQAAAAIASTDSAYSIVEVEEQAKRAEGSAAPAYPADLLKNGTEGAVFVRFVVDTLGHIDPSTIHVLQSTNDAFTRAVTSVMPHMTFTPATKDGRPVRQIAEQNFAFRLTTAMRQKVKP